MPQSRVDTGMEFRWLGLGLAVLLAGCGQSDAGAGATGSGGQAGAASDGGGSGGVAGQAACSADPGPIPPGSACVEQVTGSVLDGNDAPVSDLMVSVCGPVCWYATTDSTGAFRVDVGVHLLKDLYSTEPHGRPTRTSFYYPLPAGSGSVLDAGTLRVFDLPASGPSLVVDTDKQGAPAQSVTSGDVKLLVTDGVAVSIDVEDLALGAQGKMFRALAIPEARRGEFVGEKLEQLFAFTPFEAAFVDASSGKPAQAQLSVANGTQLPAGSAVEWLALGSYLFADWVKPATFEVVATGHVSADGARVEMDAGQGLRYLTWVGVRAKP